MLYKQPDSRGLRVRADSRPWTCCGRSEMACEKETTIYGGSLHSKRTFGALESGTSCAWRALRALFAVVSPETTGVLRTISRVPLCSGLTRRAAVRMPYWLRRAPAL